jgi:hypothetical protein
VSIQIFLWLSHIDWESWLKVGVIFSLSNLFFYIIIVLKLLFTYSRLLFLIFRFICCVVLSYYVSFLCIFIHPFCLFTSELCVSSPLLGIIIVSVYIHFNPEDGGDMFLRNVGCNSTDYTASHPRR